MKIPIGISNFKNLRQFRTSKNEPYLYVDKTLMIGDIIDDGAQVILLARPRRFGKTLNLSMLQHFFANVVDGEKTEGLFEGLNISKIPAYMNYQGKFPVLFVTFKDLKHSTWDLMFEDICLLIKNLFQEHAYLMDSDKLTSLDKENSAKYFDPHSKLSQIDVGYALRFLSELLFKHHGKKAIVLIDEYDTPIQSAYLSGFYQETMELMRGLLSQCLKDNSSLEKGVLTGITRVSKESLFSGFNNVVVYTILDKKYSQYFGFTPEEVRSICPKHYDTITKWYNGYEYGYSFIESLDPTYENIAQIIYNPWSVLSFIYHNFVPSIYWINTSDNALIKKLLTKEHFVILDELMNHQSIDVDINMHMVFEDLGKNRDAFWSLLLMAGYLTPDKEKKMRIPNKEIESYFEKMLKEWFVGNQYPQFLIDLLDSLVEGELKQVKEKLGILILETMSYHDTSRKTRESFFHGFMLAFTTGLRERYAIKSNRESGKGRYDLCLIPLKPEKDPGIIIEVKVEENATLALQQIKDKAYTTELKQHQCKQILLWGIAFDGEKVDVGLEMEAL